jgi:hypothetical protein
MTIVAIELNDAGLLAASDAGTTWPPSPGYALLDGKELLVGSAAQTRSRRKPRWVDNRYWDRLDTSPMPKPFPRSLSRADVAHTHLTHLWNLIVQDLGPGADPSVLLAIPGGFSVSQLGLILGVARASEIPVTGMVDAALAAVATQTVGARILHLEAQLHRMIWTEMVHDGELARRRVEVLETGGLASIWDAWAKRVSQLLIRQTRFDPFHHGNAEQTLYDLLPTWLDELATAGKAVVILESGGKEHRVELISEDMAAVSGDVTGPVVELARVLCGSDEPPTIMISARAAAIPGLIPQLTLLSGTPVIALEGQAAAMGTLEHRQRIASPGDDLPFVLRLPAELQTAQTAALPMSPAVVAAPQSGNALPTHVLFEGLAHAITSEPLWLGSAASSEGRGLDVGGPMPGLSRRHCAVVLSGGSVMVEDHSSYGTYLNGRRLEERSEAEVGDRIRLGSPGVEVVLIAVAERDV